MKDIRIITGKRIQPSIDTVLGLLGCRGKAGAQKEIVDIYEKMLPIVKMHIRPKAAFVRAEIDKNLHINDCKSGKDMLFVLFTLGEGISRLIEKNTKKEDILSAMVVDAMADSCLFAFEEQLLPILRQACNEEGYAVVKRMELSQDVPIETQQYAMDILDARRTLGISMTSGYMLNPVKSMCLLFALTENTTDTKEQSMRHDCGKCQHMDCQLRQTKETIVKIKNTANKEVKRISFTKGRNLLEVLQENGIAVPADCGGNGHCGKCGILLLEGELPRTPQDSRFFSEEELERGMRLSCQAALQKELTIRLLQDAQLSDTETDFVALGVDGAENSEKTEVDRDGFKEYGVAIDIGTTTLAFSLMELHSGQLIDTYTAVNRQRQFGADVISRIQASGEGKQYQLASIIKEDIRNGIQQLAEQHLQKEGERIVHIAIAGNTVMLHLLREYSCEGFSRYPFSPCRLGAEILRMEEIFPECPEKAEKDIRVTLLPGMTAFVGADITAGIYECEMSEAMDSVLFLDLGTNGEMVLKVEDTLYVASAPAGPAFEGGNIKWGMGSLPGAIAKVSIQERVPQIVTIKDAEPKGICGTGVIEAVAELLKVGILDTTGKLVEPYFQKGYPLAKNSQGEDIVLTQQDIREIQMAKSAIRAGVELLMAKAGVQYDQIKKVYLAGGFGYYLNVQKAAEIGIVPKEFADKTEAVGNTALKGTLRFLQEQNLEKLQSITEKSVEVQLAKQADFQELYMKYINL